MQYLARKSNLGAKTQNEQIRIDMIQNQIHDLRMSFGLTCYMPDFVSIILDSQREVRKV